VDGPEKKMLSDRVKDNYSQTQKLVKIAIGIFRMPLSVHLPFS
jgi:hypothetical protein